MLTSWGLLARRPLRVADTDTLVSDVIGNVDVDIGQKLLHLDLHHILDKDPAGALKLAVPSVHNTQNALAEHLLHLSHQSADLVNEFGLDIVA